MPLYQETNETKQSFQKSIIKKQSNKTNKKMRAEIKEREITHRIIYLGSHETRTPFKGERSEILI